METVIDALVSKNFNRDDFQKSLDRFYVAIENAAHTMPEFSDKQHFLNTVYERFFQGYSVKVADTHGIVYTPQAIVDFMCASVAEVLQTEFGKGLGDAGVHILDPCTGTGNFIVNLLRRIPKRDLPRVYREQLFANEVMLLPYYIAALNIEHAYYELTGEYESFEGLCFVDTLDLAEEKGTFSFMTEKNTERVERQKKTPITVIIGNPPYNMGQLNENDNNKNRKYPVIDKRIAKTYAKDSVATLRRQLYDPYVRFFRWATDRLENRDGLVCLVTNNSFIDQIAFDGMRKHLLKDFTKIYHLHLEGNVRHNPTLSGTAYNVFGIQVGVGITIAVRAKKDGEHRLLFHRIEKTLRREHKLAWLTESGGLRGIQWRDLTPDARGTWLIPKHGEEFEVFIPIGIKKKKKARRGEKAALFEQYGRGVATNADAYVYDYSRSNLVARAKEMVEDFNSQLDRWKRNGQPEELDGFLQIDESVHKWIRNTKRTLLRGSYARFEEATIRSALYRPFNKRFHFFHRTFNEDTYQFPRFFPSPTTETENRLIALTSLGSEKPFMLLISNSITDMHLVGAGCAAQCFPFYVYIYDEDGSHRHENITDWALKQFRQHYGDKKINKWDIFHYVYGLLHHPGYREKFADNLKRELPRIPFAPDFHAFAAAGAELARLHLDYERLEPYSLKWLETPDVPLSYRVEDKMRLNKDKTAL
ncbi:MAG TPA: type ISP restriction/modification enzyme, partial [Gemmataceae bacterium]